MNMNRGAQKTQFLPLTTPRVFKQIDALVSEIVGEPIEVSLSDAAFFIIGFGLASGHRPEVIRTFLLKIDDMCHRFESEVGEGVVGSISDKKGDSNGTDN